MFLVIEKFTEREGRQISFYTLRPQIKTLLETISTIQEVSGTPMAQFSGYPACYVVPSENEADYETTRENVRVYAFMVRVFYETRDTGIAVALPALESLVDTILDTFDKEDLKTSATRTVGVGLPTGYTFLNIFAHPVSWGEVTAENLIMAELSIKIRISIDINST